MNDLLRQGAKRPIVAIIGGINAPADRIMGHAGAFVLPGEPSALDKIKALEDAGAAIVNHPSRFGPVLKGLLAGKSAAAVSGGGVRAHGSGGLIGQQQVRAMHTRSWSYRPQAAHAVQNRVQQHTSQRRQIILAPNTALKLLKDSGVAVSAAPTSKDVQRTLAVTINRSTGMPCILVISGNGNLPKVELFDFDYRQGAGSVPVEAVCRALGFSTNAVTSLQEGIDRMVKLFTEKEAYLIETRVVESRGETGRMEVQVASAKLGFDDAAFRSCKRQGDIQALRDIASVDPAELDVEKDGIVYIKLDGGDIGTLVNGAGLAMNTIDALADAGGKAANFLDTGGKATSETVKKSFEVILKDDRVKVSVPRFLYYLPGTEDDIGTCANKPLTQSIFVNIFGGLTHGDMIAEGVILAFKDLQMTVPVVVRIRGTNEREGQRMIQDSGLPLFAYDDFDEAAARAIELARQA